MYCRPASAPAATTAVEPISHGRACLANPSARSSMRVRRMVGQNVTSVPTTVSPIQPSRFVMVWATRNRQCQVLSSPNASVAPKAAPTGR